MGTLILKRASASRPSGDWSDDDFDVLTNDTVQEVPVHVVAVRCGHDPAVLLRSLPSARGKADTAVIGALARGVLGKNGQ
jgi:hypothetical protein